MIYTKYRMFSKLDNFSLTGNIPQCNGFIIRKADDMDIVCCKLAAVNSTTRGKTGLMSVLFCDELREDYKYL